MGASHLCEVDALVAGRGGGGVALTLDVNEVLPGLAPHYHYRRGDVVVQTHPLLFDPAVFNLAALKWAYFQLTSRVVLPRLDFDRLARIHPPYAASHAPRAMLSAHAPWMLIGACNLML